jgi:fermentation-respiration switch protein FrsA (DUF1100 family)
MEYRQDPPETDTVRISHLDVSDSDAAVLLFETSSGNYRGLYHFVPGAVAAVLWAGGVGGGFDGPARGMYPRLANVLKRRGIASLRLDYRMRGDMVGCVVDVMAGVEFLALSVQGRVALVGHSFGGAVVIAVGSTSNHVAGVAALSSQTYGASGVPLIAPRPVLFIHGASDLVLPASGSRELYAKARDPKEIRIHPGCGHGLDECREQVDSELTGWLLRVLAPVPAAQEDR